METIKHGGEGGIRTPETLPSLHALQACALNRARPPLHNGRYGSMTSDPSYSPMLWTSVIYAGEAAQVPD